MRSATCRIAWSVLLGAGCVRVDRAVGGIIGEEICSDGMSIANTTLHVAYPILDECWLALLRAVERREY